MGKLRHTEGKFTQDRGPLPANHGGAATQDCQTHQSPKEMNFKADDSGKDSVKVSKPRSKARSQAREPSGPSEAKARSTVHGASLGKAGGSGGGADCGQGQKYP